MSLFKCKMCGGSLEIAAGTTVIECEYCGTQQTLPKLDDEKRANLYDRANHFRRNNEFDKAMGIYENILNEDNTDAEAYWSLVLCRYGIEYVEDPASHKRIPTVNRAQFTSIFDDDNYKSALQYADSYQRKIYEEEAKAINEIQKGILAISQKEEPFDVFICYKETDANGKRTQDSVLAQDLYYGLKNEGFKVFFARITLEDKLGSAYEPYIFAALNSAKVMVVLGTKSEFFNAVWVKNEWSRYLALIKQGQKKMLIPAYKDMDPYDLPEEFSHLQAQDMSKLGFMQDLIRGIKKIAKSEEPKTTVVKETVIQSQNNNISPLLERAFMFLEDGDWKSAEEYAEKALDIEPKNSRAYIVKLMVEFEVKSQEDLKDLSEPFDDNVNYQKALRFADEPLKNILLGYIETINNNIVEATYEEACDFMSYYEEGLTANYDLQNCQLALSYFESILGYKDADILAEKCRQKIARLQETIRKDEILSSAKAKIEENTFDSYKEAVELLSTIKGWNDADTLVVESQAKIEELTAKAEAERLENERLAKIRAKRNKKIAIITTPIVCVIIAFIIILNAVIIPNNKYNDAIALMDAGKYIEAISAFEVLNGHKDSEDKILECKEKQFIIDNGQAVYDKWGWLQVGDTITFGQYEQDNSTASGNEAIEWIILKVENGKAFVISKYALDYQQFHAKSGYTAVWEHSTIRKWLSEDFYNSAFSNTEKSKILTSTIESEKDSFNEDWMTTTQDKVFLLSVDEAKEYFSDDATRQCTPSKYALSKGVDIDTELGTTSWWLRSLGGSFDYSATVTNEGIVGAWGLDTEKYCAVRPAMWIDLNA